MINDILNTIAQDSPFSYEEICAAYELLQSIDAVIVGIELAMVTDRPFTEAIDIIYPTGPKSLSIGPVSSRNP